MKAAWNKECIKIVERNVGFAKQVYIEGSVKHLVNI
jgi:hypothetical protein